MAEVDYNQLLKSAKLLAVNYHFNQTDKGGNPYILHINTVVAGVEDIKAKIVAYLHDLVEDTHMTIEQLSALGFTKEIVEAVDVISKTNRNEDYLHYIKRVKENPLARVVKISDLKDNINLSRLKNITSKDINRCEKYLKALDILIN